MSGSECYKNIFSLSSRQKRRRVLECSDSFNNDPLETQTKQTKTNVDNMGENNSTINPDSEHTNTSHPDNLNTTEDVLLDMHIQSISKPKTVEQNNMYAIVKFDDESVSEIPSKWLFDNNTMCWWPPTKNVSSYILRNSTPDESWNQYNIVVERFCENLEKARKIAEDINYTSEEERGRGRRQKKPVNREFSEYDSSSSEESLAKRKLEKARIFVKSVLQEPLLEEARIFTITVQGTLVEDLSSSNNSDQCALVEEENNSIGNDDVTLTEVKEINCQHANIEKQLNKIVKMIAHLDLQLADMRDILSSHLNMNPNKDEFADIRKMVPIKSVEDLKQVENYINEEKHKLIMLRFVTKIGGATGKENLNRIYKVFFSNEFAIQCSWLGLRNNYRISGSPLVTLVKDVVTKAFADFQYKDFEHVSSEWFRHGKQRLVREQNRGNSEK